jgi:hypothetical protein
MRRAFALFLALCLPATVSAAVPEAAWKAMKERMVHLDLTDGSEVEGQLIGVDGPEAVVIRPDGVVATVKKADVTEMRGITQPNVPAASPGSTKEPSPSARPKDAAPATAAVPSNPATPASSGVGVSSAQDPSARSAQMRKTGQILGTAGIGPALGGLIFPVGIGIALGAATDGDPNEGTYTALQAGRTMIGIGVPLYASGMAMIIIGGQLKKQADKIDAGKQSALPALAPSLALGPEGIPLGVAGRF